MEIGCNIQLLLKPRVRVTKAPLGHTKGKKLFNMQSISGKLLDPKSQRAGRVHRHSQLVLPPKDFFYIFLQGMKPKI